MKWMKASKGDKWILFSAQQLDGSRTALGVVERVGIAYEARDDRDVVICRRSLCRLAMDAVEKSLC